jgi:hypothetical protein
MYIHTIQEMRKPTAKLYGNILLLVALFGDELISQKRPSLHEKPLSKTLIECEDGHLLLSGSGFFNRQDRV